jgi:hypothetical protein
MAEGLLLLLLAAFVFLRTVRGRPRLANVLLKGPKAAAAGAAS